MKTQETATEDEVESEKKDFWILVVGGPGFDRRIEEDLVVSMCGFRGEECSDSSCGNCRFIKKRVRIVWAERGSDAMKMIDGPESFPDILILEDLGALDLSYIPQKGEERVRNVIKVIREDKFFFRTMVIVSLHEEGVGNPHLPFSIEEGKDIIPFSEVIKPKDLRSLIREILEGV